VGNMRPISAISSAVPFLLAQPRFAAVFMPTTELDRYVGNTHG
jgi:hypothetical protein